MLYQLHICYCLNINEISLLYLAYVKLAVSLICTWFLQMNLAVLFPIKWSSFLVKSYMGFSSFCSSGQNILRKFTTPVKLLHPLGVLGGCNFWIASNLFLRGFTHTFLFSINISFPMYCRLVLNSWHFFGDIFKPFFNKDFSRSSNLFMCVSLMG